MLINVKRTKELFISAIIISVAIVTCYGLTTDNEEKKEIEKVIATYFEGFRTENLDLVMSTISHSFSRIANIGKEIGVPVNYEQTKKGEAELFETNNILNLSFEITKIEIADNKATVETNTSLEAFSLKESKKFGGSRTFIFFLKKENNKWLIISY